MDLAGLLARFKEHGDASAMEAFVRATRPRLLATARRIGNPADAEDTVQAAYHALLRRGGDVDPAPPIAWMLTTVVRIAYRRKAIVRREAELAQRLDRPHAEPPADRAARTERTQLLHDAVRRLPPRYRDVVVLRSLQELSAAETARLLDLPESTVRTRHQRARALLRGRLAPRIALGLLLPGWWFQDLLGGVMKVKTAGAVGAMVLAGGLVGFGTGRLAPGHASAQPVRTVHGPFHRVAELEAELAAAREETERLRSERPAPKSERAERTRPEAAPRFRNPFLEPARALNVPPEVMAEAIRVEGLLRERDPDANSAAHVFARHGELGYRAAVALLRGGRAGDWFRDKLLAPNHAPGLESLLRETILLPGLRPYPRASAVRGLQSVDTPDVRDFLVERIGVERDPIVFYALAETLGALGDDRGAPACADKLLFDDPLEESDWKGFRRVLLYQLGRMGGENARRVVADFVRDERATVPGDLLSGLNAAYVLDREFARTLARTVHDGPRAAAFDQHDLMIVKNLAGIR